MSFLLESEQNVSVDYSSGEAVFRQGRENLGEVLKQLFNVRGEHMRMVLHESLEAETSLLPHKQTRERRDLDLQDTQNILALRDEGGVGREGCYQVQHSAS